MAPGNILSANVLEPATKSGQTQGDQDIELG